MTTRRSKLLSCVFTGILALQVAPAYATFTVYSPKVTKGEVELEAKSRFDFDDRASEDGYQRHLLEANYGVTDWWKAGAEAIWVRNPDGDYEYALSELTSTFELAEEGEYWIHPGIRTVYVFNHENRKADKVEALLLLQKKYDPLTLTANLKVEQEVGSYASKDVVLGTSLRARYKIHSWLQPSLEYYNTYGELSDWQDYDDQTHRLGPVWYGKLTDELSFEAGYLFGLSDVTEDGAVKLKLEYEFQF
jgi:hypothetical protein